MEQQLAHHTVNGCNVKAGDLMGSGTISGGLWCSCIDLVELYHWGNYSSYLLSKRNVIFLCFGHHQSSSVLMSLHHGWRLA